MKNIVKLSFFILKRESVRLNLGNVQLSCTNVCSAKLFLQDCKQTMVTQRKKSQEVCNKALIRPAYLKTIKMEDYILLAWTGLEGSVLFLAVQDK